MEIMYLIVFLFLYIHTQEKDHNGFWGVFYEKESCNGGYQFAVYEGGSSCYHDQSNTSIHYGCDTKKASTVLYENEECVGDPWETITYNFSCNEHPFGNYHQFHCHDDYEVNYDAGVFYQAVNTGFKEISRSNPLSTELYYPVTNGKCERCLLSSGHYYKASCDYTFEIGLFSDKDCTIQKHTSTLYPGDFKDLGAYLDPFGYPDYAMFVECLSFS